MAGLSELTGGAVPQIMRMHFVARLAVLLHPLAVAGFAWLAPHSITARMVLGVGDIVSLVVLVAMTIVSGIGVVDIVVNDLLPARWSIPCVQRNRHLGYLLLGAMLLMQVFAILDDIPPGGGVLIVYHLATGIVCGLFAASATVRPSDAL